LKRRSDVDIGKEEERILVEPAEDPFEHPAGPPAEKPVDPEPEKVVTPA
jgi:hypothetical protein